MKIKLDSIFREYQGESSFIFLMSAMNLTCSAFEYFSIAPDINIFLRVMLSLSGTAIIIFSSILIATYLRILFGKGKFNQAAKHIILFLTLVISVLDIFSLFYYQCKFDSGMLNAILETNNSEAGEFFRAYVIQAKFVIYLSIAVICVVILRWLFTIITGKKIFWIAIIFTASLSGIFSWCQNLFFVQFFSQFRLPVMILEVFWERHLFEQALTQARREVVLTRNESSIPDFVFILGESTSRNHMSLYGYKLDTTPNLMKRKNHNELYVFNNITSPHAATSKVMEKLFTFYNLESQSKNPELDWYTYTSLFNILSQAGYKTMWLSNQEPFGVWGRAGRFYAAQVDLSRFTTVRSSRISLSSEVKSYDEKLLPLLDEALTQSSSKNFYVIHLMGTHVDYSMRYPEEFKKFSPEDEQGLSKLINLSERQKKIRSEYDNAVLYNDFIVNEIIKRFESRNAIIIYVSDHGQEVFNTINFMGHSEAANRTHSMLEVPMIIWTSEKFRASYSDICERISRGVNHEFVTDNIIHVILSIMKIETKDYDPAGSFLLSKAAGYVQKFFTVPKALLYP